MDVDFDGLADAAKEFAPLAKVEIVVGSVAGAKIAGAQRNAPPMRAASMCCRTTPASNATERSRRPAKPCGTKLFPST